LDPLQLQAPRAAARGHAHRSGMRLRQFHRQPEEPEQTAAHGDVGIRNDRRDVPGQRAGHGAPRPTVTWRILLCAIISAATFSCATAREDGRPRSLELTPCVVPKSDQPVLCGRHAVFEDRAAAAGRRIVLNVVVVRLYTTPIAMDDLDEVRAALGYSKINLYGASYGSQAALQYLRQYPTRVRSVAVAGVATPAAKQPLHFASAAQEALDRLIHTCAADAPCRQAFPNFKCELDALLTSLDHTPATFELSNPTTGLTQSIRMSRGVFVERLRLMLYEPNSASRVPLLIHRAAHGDWASFARFTPTGVAAGVSAMYLAVTCAETAAHITEEDILRETRNTFMGEYRTRTHLRACA